MNVIVSNGNAYNQAIFDLHSFDPALPKPPLGDAIQSCAYQTANDGGNNSNDSSNFTPEEQQKHKDLESCCFASTPVRRSASFPGTSTKISSFDHGTLKA